MRISILDIFCKFNCLLSFCIFDSILHNKRIQIKSKKKAMKSTHFLFFIKFITNTPIESLRKNLCKFNNSDKKRYCERLEKQPLNFFTVYNKYRNLSSFFNGQLVEVHNFQFSQNSASVSQRYCLKISGDRCFGKAGICCNICKGYIFSPFFTLPVSLFIIAHNSF